VRFTQTLFLKYDDRQDSAKSEIDFQYLTVCFIYKWNMRMKKLHCDPSTMAGPIDYRVLKFLEKKFGKFESDYIDFLENHHGGIIENVSVKVDSKQCSIERFLTIVDDETKLEGAFRPHFTDSREDERVLDSIYYLVDGEHSTARALFGVLLPFATTQVEMALDRAYVDLFCFDFISKENPRIVLWLSNEANDVSIDRDRLPIEQQYDKDDKNIGLPWERFIVPVAKSFEEFMDMLEVQS
ncbi:SMI1/KNR4 family protein, partial [Granulosicoccus sp.]|nr:SMI1/KNR4 family protein [Granulosicoccus sp.]